MESIKLKDMAKYPRNVRATQVDISTMANAITAPQTDIMVSEVPGDNSGPNYEVLNGRMRLDVLLMLLGKVLVRLTGNDEQFYVHRDAGGRLVRF